MNTAFRRALLVTPIASALTVCGFTGALAADLARHDAVPSGPAVTTSASPWPTAAPAAETGRNTGAQGSDGAIPGNGHGGNGTQGNHGQGSDGAIPGNGPVPAPKAPQQVPAPETPAQAPSQPTPEQAPAPQAPAQAPAPESTTPRTSVPAPQAPRPLVVVGTPVTSVQEAEPAGAPGPAPAALVSTVRAPGTEAPRPALVVERPATTAADAEVRVSAARASASTSALPESLAYTGVGPEVVGAGALGALLLAVGAALRLRRG